MKNQTFRTFISTIGIILIFAVISSCFAGCFNSNETETELSTTQTSVLATEQIEIVRPESGFTINPESFMTDGETLSEITAGNDDEFSSSVSENNTKPAISRDYLSSLSANDIKMLNIFLSNFSEALVKNIDTSDMEAMIQFVCLNTRINYSDKITYDGVIIDNPRNEKWSCSGWVSEEYVAERVDRFFGVKLKNTSTDYYVYSDGKYYFPMADGETYAHFTKVTSATENPDGTVTVEYDVYWYDVAYDTPPSYVYEGIGTENHDNLCDYQYSGIAVVKPVQLGGEGYANYKLVSLEEK